MTEFAERTFLSFDHAPKRQLSDCHMNARIADARDVFMGKAEAPTSPPH